MPRVYSLTVKNRLAAAAFAAAIIGLGVVFLTVGVALLAALAAVGLVVGTGMGIYRRLRGGRPALRFDLTAVTFIDAAGKAFLAARCAQGAELIACGCLMRAFVAEITQASVPATAMVRSPDSRVRTPRKSNHEEQRSG